MRWFLGFLAILAAFSPSPALAQGRIDCNVLHSKILKRAVHYCVQVPGSYDKKDANGQESRYPVLYYLHGLGDNEQSFSRSGGWTLIEDLREHGKIGDFLIVAPEGGASFYINSADGSNRWSDFFLREFMPYIEGKYRTVAGREGRAIMAISMGGFGALRGLRGRVGELRLRCRALAVPRANRRFRPDRGPRFQAAIAARPRLRRTPETCGR